MTPMEAQVKALFTNLNGRVPSEGCSSDDSDLFDIKQALTDAYAQGRRDEQDAIVKRVELLVGKDSGNWNRAITYAMDAIRAQAVQDGPHKLDQLRKGMR